MTRGLLGKATQTSSPDHPEPIAIIGIGCRLAGSIADPTQFWNFLLEGRSDIREVPEERWAPYLRRDPRNAAVLKETTRRGTFIDDLAGFDAEFFGVSPREAELMDPQQRLALEVSWEALEHAGVPPRSLAGSDTAVLMGVNSDDYGKLIMEDLPGIEAWTGIGTSLCGVANRVSHLLDLRGPSVALDAACAASLVAVHQACQMLRAGETSLALAGGVSALIGPGLTRVLDEAGATAPDGRCKTFDASADGYGRGEGAGVVVLKRLFDAQRDGDRVLALVRGGAVAQDGRTVGIMSPNGDAQAAMFRRACESAGVAPSSVDFVEAHGTGTPTGDPIEVRALASVYGADRPADAPCRIGSVKPNVGHLEGGAGVVGLIKATLALHHETIPPTAGLKTLTPQVDWANSGLRVPTDVEPWPRTQTPRRAAVCSYGYGGTIAHVLLEEAPPQGSPSVADRTGLAVVPISARSTVRLRTQARALADHLRSGDHTIGSVSATAWTRRSHEPVRAAVTATDIDTLVAGLDALADGTPDQNLVTGTALSAAADGAVWVFSGHGSHWAGMGKRLLGSEPAFAEVIDTIDPVFGAELGFSARDALSTAELGGTDRVQALTFAMQVGLAAVLRARGVEPAAVIGHSVGEVAACVTAGVFDLTIGAAVACYRARGFRSVMGHGAMALVRMPFAEAESRLTGRTDVVAAISASVESTVVSGDVDAVEEISRTWTDDGVMVRRVNTDVAFHSPAMDTLTAELARLTAQLPPSRDPQTPLYTTALADPRSSAPRNHRYWVANLRDRVRFAEAVTAAIEDGHRVFLEVSAHPVVSHSIVETLTAQGIEDHAVIPVLRRDRDELHSVATAVGALHCSGAPVDHDFAGAVWADDLPVTQWHHRRFWRTPTPPPGGRGIHDVDSHTLLGGRTEVTGAVAATMWQTRLEFDNRPYPGDHPVCDTEIIPAAVLLNTFLTAAAGTDLVDVRLRTPVAPSRTRDVQVVLQDRGLTLSTRLVDDEDSADDGGWLTHCSAVAATDHDIDDLLGRTFDEASARQRCTEALPPNHVVDTLATLGVAAMGFDWQILELNRGDGQLLAVVAANGDRSQPATWAPLLDAATSAASTIFDGPPRLRMPARIERVHVYGQPPAVGILYVQRRAGTTTTDVVIADRSGAVCASLTGMSFEELESPAGRDVSRMMHTVSWHEVPWRGDERPSAAFVVGGDDDIRGFVIRDLDDAGVPHAVYADPADLAHADLDQRDAVVLVLPRLEDAPDISVDVVMRTLRHLVERAAKSRMWVLTQYVHEGFNVLHAPLWGLGRVAAAEHPDVFSGVLDVAGAKLPVGALTSLRGHPVVVVRDEVTRVARLASAGRGAGAPLQCSTGGTYLITGGTGVLGLRMAQRLADVGARRLVLVSRSGIPERSEWRGMEDSELIRTVAALEDRGVSVHVLALDIGAPGAGKELKDALRDLPPVRGVIHAAGVEAGALLMNTTQDDIEKAMRPKVDGTLALHEVFPPEQLDWMVFFSSCGYLAGFPGQGAYACANSFLDVMARYRHGLGDRTVSVAWTAWRGLGMGSTSGFVAAQLDALGMDTIGSDEAILALDLAMRGEQANIVVLPVLPAAASVPMLADVAPADTEDPGEHVEPAELDPQSVTEHVVAAVAAQLGLSEDDVDTALPLVEIGVDSIMTVGLLRQLEKLTGLALPPTLLWEYPTAAAVADRIAEMLSAPVTLSRT